MNKKFHLNIAPIINMQKRSYLLSIISNMINKNISYFSCFLSCPKKIRKISIKNILFCFILEYFFYNYMSFIYI